MGDSERSFHKVEETYATKEEGIAIKRKKLIKPALYRSEFQRDKDRIIHSKSFRRMEYKSQVYLSQKGDHLRTRLTHTLEVAQLARTISAQLGLNSDLAEAIALGHDLGHTPFGHAGERKIQDLLKEFGIGFKHNVQSVRIVDFLEKKYEYNGLNLTLAVREGILKHTKVNNSNNYYLDLSDLYPEKEFSVTLEGQVVALADEIAQATHDLDDFLRYNIVILHNMLDYEFFNDLFEFIKENYSSEIICILFNNENEQLAKDYLIRCLVDFLVTTSIEHSRVRLKKASVLNPFEINEVYIKFDEDFNNRYTSFKNDLYNEKIFKNQKVMEMDIRGQYIIERLFKSYIEYPNLMPEETFERYNVANESEKPLIIANHIAGMTDRYAIEKFDDLINIE